MTIEFDFRTMSEFDSFVQSYHANPNPQKIETPTKITIHFEKTEYNWDNVRKLIAFLSNSNCPNNLHLCIHSFFIFAPFLSLLSWCKPGFSLELMADSMTCGDSHNVAFMLANAMKSKQIPKRLSLYLNKVLCPNFCDTTQILSHLPGPISNCNKDAGQKAHGTFCSVILDAIDSIPMPEFAELQFNRMRTGDPIVDFRIARKIDDARHAFELFPQMFAAKPPLAPTSFYSSHAFPPRPAPVYAATHRPFPARAAPVSLAYPEVPEPLESPKSPCVSLNEILQTQWKSDWAHWEELSEETKAEIERDNLILTSPYSTHVLPPRSAPIYTATHRPLPARAASVSLAYPEVPAPLESPKSPYVSLDKILQTQWKSDWDHWERLTEEKRRRIDRTHRAFLRGNM